MRSVLRLLVSISLVALAYTVSPVHPASAAALCAGNPATITGSGTIKGTKYSDIIVGSKKSDRISGGGGDDIICGGGGGDLIYGDDGDDWIYGDGDNDEIHGGRGNDIIDGDNNPYHPSATGNDMVYGDDGNDSLWDDKGVNLLDGGDGNDYVSSFGTALGGPGDDQQVIAYETCLGCSDGYADGGTGNDAFIQILGGIAIGGPGDDVVVSSNLGDEAHGDDGSDYVAGSADNILLDAGYGIDSCATFGSNYYTLISCEFIV